MPQGSLHKADLLGKDKVLALPLPAFVLFYGENHIQVAGGAAVYTGFALAPHPQACSRVNPCRHAHDQFASVGNDAFALAFGATLADDAPGAFAGRAGHGDLEKAL